jgi:molybdopterin/thiamine biosynthesis adenylyltransferase
MIALSEEEILRYSRNMVLAEVGTTGQERLKQSRALVVGAGGLGSSALLYLAAAGVGEIVVVDDDEVELSNLQRQIIYRGADIGRSKVESAADAIYALNPNCRVQAHRIRLSASNIRELGSGYQVVLDASDNFPTRFLVADYCWFEKMPLVSAAAIGFYGQLLVVYPGEKNPCYRCLFPEVPEATQSCREGGILGAVVGVMGSLQAAEALKILLGREPELSNQILNFDALHCRFIAMQRAKEKSCRLCGDNPGITTLIDSQAAPCQDGGLKGAGS